MSRLRLLLLLLELFVLGEEVGILCGYAFDCHYNLTFELS